MDDIAQRARVMKIRRIATGLLVLMAVIFLLARRLEAGSPGWGYLAAFAEAAMVGALADWFAVTALFRHPLGLPIPHTAIIPENKDRLADSIADFLENNFLTHEVLLDELGQIRFAAIAVQWVKRADNTRWLAQRIVRALPLALGMLQDAEIRSFLSQGLRSALAGIRLGPILAEILSMLIAERRHEALFRHLLEQAARLLQQNLPLIRRKIYEGSPLWLPRMFNEQLFLGLVDSISALLDEMREPDSKERERFEAFFLAQIKALRESQEREQVLQGFMRLMLSHPLLRDYLEGLGRELGQRMEEDLAHSDSRLLALTGQIVGALAQALGRDAALQGRIDRGLRQFGARTLTRQRSRIVGLIRRVVRQWDAATVSGKIELYVGRDLQYIRINGTVVGGLVGLAMHGLWRLV
jgi:uncharacterized membrane-anchored protein YjiN (DUF445 family)